MQRNLPKRTILTTASNFDGSIGYGKPKPLPRDMQSSRTSTQNYCSILENTENGSEDNSSRIKSLLAELKYTQTRISQLHAQMQQIQTDLRNLGYSGVIY